MISEMDGDREEPLAKPVDESEANIKTAIRVWNHPSLANVSSEDKRSFLHAKGVSDAEIRKAWERIVEMDPPANGSVGSVNATTNSDGNNNITGQGQPGPTNSSTRQVPFFPTHGSMYPPSSDYPQPPYYNNSNNNSQYQLPSPQEIEEDGPLTLVQGASLVTLGGFIGLTAAAASRWLNGGDFELFPGPRYPSNVAEQRSQFLQRLEEEAEGEKEDDDDDDEEYVEEDVVDQEIVAALSQQKLIQQVESIAESLRANTVVQEKILSKLATAGTSITDETMGFLRSTDSKSNETKEAETELNKSDVQMIWKELVQIQAELRSLNNSVKGKKSEKKVESTLKNLDVCIEGITKKMLGSTERSLPEPQTANSSMEDTQPPEVVSTISEEVIQKVMEETRIDAPPIATSQSILDAIRAVAEKNDAKTRQVGCQLLLLYVANLSGNPTNPRYRKIYTSNESFKKVDQLVGGKGLLIALGFEESGNYLEWFPNGSPAQESSAMEFLKKAAEALRILKTGEKSEELTNSALAVFPANLTLETTETTEPTEQPSSDVADSPSHGLIKNSD